MPITVIYPGVPGSFSEQALMQCFPNPVQKKNAKQFEEIFTLLAADAGDYGVLPIENSSTGGIYEVFDYLKHHNFYIVGETFVHVTHHLLGCAGTTLSSIEEVYSHPQGFQQSQDFLKSYSNWILTPYFNTAISAEFVGEKQDPKKAAIASKRAAEIYDLTIIQPNIQDVDNNYTRFVIIKPELEIDPAHTKISLVFALPHSVGSLHHSLGIFAEHELNLLNLQSRPIKDKPWQCYFYLDIAGNLHDSTVRTALDELQRDSHFFQILGSYTACDNNGKTDR